MALLAAHDGATQDARRHAKHAIWLVSMMGEVAPWISVEARLLVARASLLVGDVALSRVLCREAQDLVAAMPDSGNLPERIAQIQQIIDSDTAPIGITATPMTPAEMRVLRYLPTHLTFAAIADELFVSRNTVKTQAISIYRKLGVSSRGARGRSRAGPRAARRLTSDERAPVPSAGAATREPILVVTFRVLLSFRRVPWPSPARTRRR